MPTVHVHYAIYLTFNVLNIYPKDLPPRTLTLMYGHTASAQVNPVKKLSTVRVPYQYNVHNLLITRTLYVNILDERYFLDERYAGLRGSWPLKPSSINYS